MRDSASTGWTIPALISPAFISVALVTLPRSAHAQPPPTLEVEREPGAEECPDTRALIGQVETLLGRPIAQQPVAYRVTFQRIPQGFAAALRHGTERTPVRTLQAREPNCAALAHAAAVALTVLLDSQIEDTASDQPATKPAAPPAPAAEPNLPPPRTAEPDKSGAVPGARHLAAFATLGAGAAVGLLRPVAFVLVADAGLELSRLRGSLGLLWLPPHTSTLPPGSARDDLISASLRACYAIAGSSAWRLDGCSGAFVGSARAEARGFAQNTQRGQLFLAFPAGLAFALHSGPLSWELNASALVPCPRNEFQIEGRGAVYRPPPIAALFSLRVVLESGR